MVLGASSSGALNARSLPSRRQVFAAFAEELLAAPFTDQTFHFVIPALADAQAAFPYEPFLSALLSREGGSSGTGGGAPWLFYFVLTVGENHLGTKRTPRLHRSRAVRPGTAAQGWVSCCQRSLWLGAPWEGAFVGGCVLRCVPGDVLGRVRTSHFDTCHESTPTEKNFGVKQENSECGAIVTCHAKPLTCPLKNCSVSP